MPSGNVVVRAHFVAIYNVTTTVNNSARGTAYSSPTSARQGTRFDLFATPNTGFTFIRWERASGAAVTINNSTSEQAWFSMPNGHVTIRAVFEPATEFNITASVDPPASGTASASPNRARQGTTVNITATALPGHQFVQWIVISGNVTISNASSPNASFVMPNGAVEVRAVFQAVAATPTPEPTPTPVPTEPPEPTEPPDEPPEELLCY